MELDEKNEQKNAPLKKIKNITTQNENMRQDTEDTKKWSYFEHKGPLFIDEYKRHNT